MAWKDDCMTRIGRAAICLAVVPLVGVIAQYAHACSCIVPPPPHEAAAKADVVFVGTVLKIAEERDPGDGWVIREIKQLFDWEIDHGYWEYAVEFEVSTMIKGESPGRIVVRTNTTSPACGYSFRQAAEYLVYAYSHEGKTYTSICTRTTPVQGAEDEIQELLNIGGQPSNNGLNLTSHPVTVRACARPAPGWLAG